MTRDGAASAVLCVGGTSFLARPVFGFPLPSSPLAALGGGRCATPQWGRQVAQSCSVSQDHFACFLDARDQSEAIILPRAGKKNYEKAHQASC